MSFPNPTLTYLCSERMPRDRLIFLLGALIVAWLKSSCNT